MIIIGEIGAAAALLIVSVLTDPVSLGAALFVYGAFASLPSPAIAAYIADVVPAERQQRAYVLQSWAINFGYAIGPIVANRLVKISYSLMFYVEAAVMISRHDIADCVLPRGAAFGDYCIGAKCGAP